MQSIKVGIIGAGPSGICAAKHAQENNMIPMVFEQKPEAGGIWSSSSHAWSDLCAIHSRFSMSFSDFPWPKDAPIIPTLHDVNTYLNLYIDHFELRKHFNFSSQVKKVHQEANKQWKIEWVELSTNKVKETLVDYIIFSSGLNSQTRLPTNDSIEDFQGTILHSSQIRSTDNQDLQNKKVIIVGNGLSGIEISSQMVGHASSVTNVFTRPVLVVPRIFLQKDEIEPNEYNIIPVDLFLFRRENFYTSRENLIEYLKKICPIQTNKEKCSESIYYDFGIRENLPPRIIVDNKYVDYVNENKINAKMSRIKKYHANSVEFEDGTEEQVDVIIFCTGYLPNLDYFDQNLLEKLNYMPEYYRFPLILYKWTFHPSIENAAFINQALGVFFIASELQAKLAIKVFRGEKKLPDEEHLKEILEKEKVRRHQDYKIQFPNGSYGMIIDKLADELNLLPDFNHLEKTDKRIFDLLWKRPILPVQFNFNDIEKKSYCLDIINQVEEIINKKYHLNIDENSSHNEIYTQMYENFSKNFKLPNELIRYLLKK